MPRKKWKKTVARFQRVRGKTNVLFRLAQAAVDHPGDMMKDARYPVVGLQTLDDRVREFKATGPQFRPIVYKILRSSHGNHSRRMLPSLLDALKFRSNNSAHRPVIEALAILKQYRHSRQQHFHLNEVPTIGIVRDKWRQIVIEEDNDGKVRLNRIHYAICVLQTLRERLQCKEIWGVGAERYRNPDNDLPIDFTSQREAYYEALGHPLMSKNSSLASSRPCGRS